MHFFLIGFMASGKSFWAERLSKQYNIPSLDLDHQIESEIGMSISRFIEIHNEGSFRAVEHKVLLESLNSTSTIIATGGGTPCFYNNMELMNQHGITIYLKQPLEILYQRLKKQNLNRPLLYGLNSTELQKKIDQLINERECFYEKSCFTIPMNQTPESNFAKIFEQYA